MQRENNAGRVLDGNFAADKTAGDSLERILFADADRSAVGHVSEYFVGIVAGVKDRGVVPTMVCVAVGPAVYHPWQLLHLQPDFVRRAMAITAVWQATGHKVCMTKAEPMAPLSVLPPPNAVAVYEMHTGTTLGVYIF